MPVSTDHSRSRRRAPSLSELRRAYDRSRGFADEISAEASGAGSTDLSDFWREIFAERPNLPAFNDMLVMRRGFTYPLADRAKVDDRDAERAYATGAYDVVSKSVPSEFLASVEESSVGAPITFEFGRTSLTAGGIVNALTAYRIVRWCKDRGLAGRPLRVLEIGPGYGQVAAQLFGRLNIQSYTTCDLLENLFLGSFYLQATLPEEPARFVGSDEPVQPHEGFTFTLPPFLNSVRGPFDLIINSYSFQEMNKESVVEYFAYAEQNLADDGLFFSFNAHGKAGIEVASDYPTHLFELCGLSAPRKYPWQLFGTVPYELVMIARKVPLTDGEREAASSVLDGLAGAMQLGLGDQLGYLCDRLVQGQLEARDRDALDAINAVVCGAGPELKLAAAQKLRSACRTAGVGEFFEGCLEFAGDTGAASDALACAADLLDDSHAAVIAHAALAAAAVDRRTAHVHLREVELAAPHLAAEVAASSRTRRLIFALIAQRLNIGGQAQPPGLLGKLRVAARARSRQTSPRTALRRRP